MMHGNSNLFKLWHGGHAQTRTPNRGKPVSLTKVGVSGHQEAIWPQFFRILLLCLCWLVANGVRAQNEEALPAAVTNEVNAILSALAAAAGAEETMSNNMEQTEGASSTNEVATTNGATADMDSGRTSAEPLTSGREARARRFRRSDSNRAGVGMTTSGGLANALSATNSAASSNRPTASLEYSAFRLVVDRNIFNPNRQPHRPGAPAVAQKPRQVDQFSLVGTISYDKGTFAFFDGSGADFRKVLKTEGRIAGYKLAAITANSVRLRQETNEVELRVGSQMQREDEGTWRLVANSVPSASSSSAAASSTPRSSSPADNEVLKRLMQRREKD